MIGGGVLFDENALKAPLPLSDAWPCQVLMGADHHNHSVSFGFGGILGDGHKK